MKGNKVVSSSSTSTRNRIFYGLLLASLILTIAFYFSDEASRIFQSLQEAIISLETHNDKRPVSFAFGYTLIYASLTTCSIPGMFLLTLLGGKLFGFWLGLLLTAIGATSGSLLNFFLTRMLFFDSMRQRWKNRLSQLETLSANNLMVWLFTMRLLPVIPYYLLNALAALTRISGWKFYLATFIGMLPIHSIYTLAGDQLASIDTLDDILSPPILWPLFALALLSLAINFLSYRLRSTPKKVLSDGS